MKTNTKKQVDTIVCFACQKPYPRTYTQNLKYGLMELDFCFNCMPNKNTKYGTAAAYTQEYHSKSGA